MKTLKNLGIVLSQADQKKVNGGINIQEDLLRKNCYDDLSFDAQHCFCGYTLDGIPCGNNY